MKTRLNRWLAVAGFAAAWFIVIRVSGRLLGPPLLRLCERMLPAEAGELAFWTWLQLFGLLVLLVLLAPIAVLAAILLRRVRDVLLVSAAVVTLHVLIGWVLAKRELTNIAHRDREIHDTMGSARLDSVSFRLSEPDTSFDKDRVFQSGRYGDRYRQLGVSVHFTVLRPGLMRTHVTYLPASSGPKPIERTVTAAYEPGGHSFTVIMEAADFGIPVTWAVPNPRWRGHPSWVEGWHGRIETTFEHLVLDGRDTLTVQDASVERELPGFTDVMLSGDISP